MSDILSATFPRRAAWKIPRDLRRCLVPVLRTIAGLTQQILAFERRIEQVAGSRYPETLRLRQVDGVGAMTSLTVVLTLEDPRRFRTSSRVGAYLGLRPGRNQSGKGDPELHITKAGDCDLRRLLVQSAQHIMGPFGEICGLVGAARTCACGLPDGGMGGGLVRSTASSHSEGPTRRS
jgi:transposase